MPLRKRAAALEDALVYDEPPAWYYPVRESLGGAMLKAKDAAGAEAVFHEGLRRSPNNGRMLFGLLESLRAQKKTAAAEVQREYERAWAGAEIQLRVADFIDHRGRCYPLALPAANSVISHTNGN